MKKKLIKIAIDITDDIKLLQGGDNEILFDTHIKFINYDKPNKIDTIYAIRDSMLLVDNGGAGYKMPLYDCSVTTLFEILQQVEYLMTEK